VGGVGERREEENGRRGYGKRAGTSCEVRAARHGIASFAIDRAKKGRRTFAGEGLSPLPCGRASLRYIRHGQDWNPSSPSFVTAATITSGVPIRRHFKKSVVRGSSEGPTEELAER